MESIERTGAAQSGVYRDHAFSIEPWSFGGGWYWILKTPEGQPYASGSEDEEEKAITEMYRHYLIFWG